MANIVHPNPLEFEPPPFQPHPWIRGGHLQTLATAFERAPGNAQNSAGPSEQFRIEVSDGDSIVLHEDCPADWRPDDGSILLIHGLTGCHAAPYMIRLSQAFQAQGKRVFRMDMRGFGAAHEVSQNLSHAGRSDDVMAALAWIGTSTGSGPISAVGVSLGGNQLLRGFGRIGAAVDSTPAWFDRVRRIAAVSPPLDLGRCSDNMQRLPLRPYNYYFIRSLIARVPPMVRAREEFQAQIAGRRPRTLRELDDRITAPLSGFAGADEYYDRSSACHVVDAITVPTLVLAAADDPLVPVGSFTDHSQRWSDTTKLVVAKTGGHVGFLQQGQTSWMDQVLTRWFAT